MQKMLPTLLGISALLLLTACNNQSTDAKTAQAAPPEVGVVTIGVQDVPLEIELPGRLTASEVAEIRPQVNGIVVRRLFEEGSTVRAGQPLFQLDAAAFEAERAGAAAALQRAEAQLGVARTRAQRDAELLEADVISRQSAEDSAAAMRQTEADVAVAKAQLAAAQVQLDRTRITAPIGGRVEISQVTPGALVTANQAQSLTTVQRLDPMQLDIVQSSIEMLQLRGQLAQDSGSNELRLILEDGSEHPEPATLRASGMTVDPGTGAVTLRASVPNPAASLLPGMVVRARLLAGVNKDAIMAPQQGVIRSPTGEASAWFVGEDNKLQRRRLVLGRSVGNQWLVLEGMQAGDRLVVEGLQRARQDALVAPVEVQILRTGAGS